jgi:hypothetical protein
MKKMNYRNASGFLNTNEMISDYLFSRRMILEQMPLDFEMTSTVKKQHRKPAKLSVK